MIGRTRHRVQSGRGLGNIFSTIFTKLAPIARSVFSAGHRALNSTLGRSILHSAGQAAAQGGVNLIDDVLKGENVKESLKNRAKSTAEKSLTDSAKLIQTAVKRKYIDPVPVRISRQKGNKKGKKNPFIKKQKVNDIFST